MTLSATELRLGPTTIRAGYDAQKQMVTLYTPALAAVDRILTDAGVGGRASDLLLAHELFHHLEAARFPPVECRFLP